MVARTPNSESARSSQRTLCLWLIVAGNILFSSGAYALVVYYQESNRILPFSLFFWTSYVVFGCILAQIIHFAVSMILLEFRRSLKWTVTLFILAASAAMFSLALFVGQLGFSNGWIAGMSEFTENRLILVFAVWLTLGTASVLGLQVLIWPVAASLGWQMRPAGQAVIRANPRFSLLQLFGWVGFIAAFLSLIRTLIGFDDWWIGLVFALPLCLAPSLLVAVPSLVLAARGLKSLWWYVAILAYIGIVSHLESEITFILFRFRILQFWCATWFILIFNGTCAATIVVNVILLRTSGLIIDLPVWPRRVSTELRRTRAVPIGADIP